MVQHQHIRIPAGVAPSLAIRCLRHATVGARWDDVYIDARKIASLLRRAGVAKARCGDVYRWVLCMAESVAYSTHILSKGGAA